MPVPDQVSGGLKYHTRGPCLTVRKQRGEAIVMIASLSTLFVQHQLGSAPGPEISVQDGESLVMTIGAVLIFLVAITVVKGVLGVMARLAEVAIAIGGTVMVIGLVGFAGLAVFLLSMVGLGPLQ